MSVLRRQFLAGVSGAVVTAAAADRLVAEPLPVVRGWDLATGLDGTAVTLVRQGDPIPVIYGVIFRCSSCGRRYSGKTSVGYQCGCGTAT